MLLSEALLNPPKLVGPDYSIYLYRDGIYKVVKFKAPRQLIRPLRADKPKHDDPEFKPDSSVSRAKRVVLELALCNDWKYFATFTLDRTKYDRFDLEVWKSDFTQWLRDQRKRLKKNGQDLDIKFLLVPEMHSDGAWHMHGLFSDLAPELVSFSVERNMGMNVPDNLVNNGFYDWPAYRKKFGFCSFGLLKNQVAAAFYVTKYISKDMVKLVGKHSYIPSRGLNRASKHGEIYGDCFYLDRFLVNDYQFVKTGMTKVSDNLDFTFGMEFMDRPDLMDFFSYDHIDDSVSADLADAWEQMDVGMGFFL